MDEERHMLTYNYIVGNDLFERGHYQEAIEHFERCSQLHPNKIEYKRFASIAMMRLSRMYSQRALHLHSESYNHSVADTSEKVQYIEMLLQAGRYGEAMEKLIADPAISEQPVFAAFISVASSFHRNASSESSVV